MFCAEINGKEVMTNNINHVFDTDHTSVDIWFDSLPFTDHRMFMVLNSTSQSRIDFDTNHVYNNGFVDAIMFEEPGGRFSIGSSGSIKVLENTDSSFVASFDAGFYGYSNANGGQYELYRITNAHIFFKR